MSVCIYKYAYRLYIKDFDTKSNHSCHSIYRQMIDSEKHAIIL